MTTYASASLMMRVYDYFIPPSLKDAGGSRVQQLKESLPLITLLSFMITVTGFAIVYGKDLQSLHSNIDRVQKIEYKVADHEKRLTVLETSLPLYLDKVTESLEEIKTDIKEVKVDTSVTKAKVAVIEERTKR